MGLKGEEIQFNCRCKICFHSFQAVGRILIDDPEFVLVQTKCQACRKQLFVSTPREALILEEK